MINVRILSSLSLPGLLLPGSISHLLSGSSMYTEMTAPGVNWCSHYCTWG